jgi:hypothetical protein
MRYGLYDIYCSAHYDQCSLIIRSFWLHGVVGADLRPDNNISFDTSAMCQNCATIHPALAPQTRTMCRNHLKTLVSRIDSLLSDVDHIEDRYRQDGIDWHTTQQGAREFCEPAPTLSPSLFRCEAAFDLTSPQQYQNLFAPLADVAQRLSALRSDALHVPSSPQQKTFSMLFRTISSPHWTPWPMNSWRSSSHSAS